MIASVGGRQRSPGLIAVLTELLKFKMVHNEKDAVNIREMKATNTLSFAPVIMKTWHYRVHLPSSQGSGSNTSHTHMIWALWNVAMHSFSGEKSLVSYHMILKWQLTVMDYFK